MAWWPASLSHPPVPGGGGMVFVDLHSLRRLLPDLQAPSFDPSPLLIKAPPTASQPPRHRPEIQLSVPPQDSTDTRHPYEQNEESLRHSPTPPPPPLEPPPVQSPSSPPSSSSSPTKPMFVPLTMTSVLQGAGVKVSHISQEVSMLTLPNDRGRIYFTLIAGV